ncbi:UNVERIFIED_ORG: AcrR family transcriptional regulator [Microbispora rosea subsp. rosea]
MSTRRDVRRELMSAAISLSLANGFGETTVDEIASAAGVARRTFFRYFRVKEDAVFPDHDDCLRRVTEFLDTAGSARSPLSVVGEAAGIVLDMYAGDPETAVRRYELTRQVPALRERELATTSRYQHAFAAYLNNRRPDEHRDAFRLRHEVAAAAVVATHNHVLRGWLRAGGTGDVRAQFGGALAEMTDALQPWLDGRAGREQPSSDEILVVVASRQASPWKIAEEIEAFTSRSL